MRRPGPRREPGRGRGVGLGVSASARTSDLLTQHIVSLFAIQMLNITTWLAFQFAQLGFLFLCVVVGGHCNIWFLRFTII